MLLPPGAEGGRCRCRRVESSSTRRGGATGAAAADHCIASYREVLRAADAAATWSRAHSMRIGGATATPPPRDRRAPKTAEAAVARSIELSRGGGAKRAAAAHHRTSPQGQPMPRGTARLRIESGSRAKRAARTGLAATHDRIASHRRVPTAADAAAARLRASSRQGRRRHDRCQRGSSHRPARARAEGIRCRCRQRSEGGQRAEQAAPREPPPPIIASQRTGACQGTCCRCRRTATHYSAHTWGL